MLKGLRTGLDIGTSSIKVVQLQDGPNGTSLYRLGIADLDRGETKSDDDASFPLVDKLRNVISETGLRGKVVNSVITDPSIYIRELKLPRISEGDLREGIKWQAEKYLPFSLEEAVIDFQVSDNGDGLDRKWMKAIVVAVKKRVINEHISLLESAGLIPEVISIVPFALIKSLKRNYQLGDGEVLALINVGAESTEVNIIKDNVLQLNRSFPLGGYQFTRAIAKVLGTDFHEAERLKREDEERKEIDVLSLLQAAFKQMDEEIEFSFQCYEDRFPRERMGRIILAGGSANFKGLSKFLSRELEVEIEIADPFHNIEVDQTKFDGQNLKKMAPSLMVAVGSALGSE